MPGDAEGQGKKGFFKSLYDLDDDEDPIEADTGQNESIEFLQKTKPPIVKRPNTASALETNVNKVLEVSPQPRYQTNKHEMRRSASAPGQITKLKLTTQASNVNNVAPTNSRLMPSLLSSSIPSVNASSSTERAKRRQTKDVRFVSSTRKIFEGLRFFFFPNNDTNVPRRQRIQKTIAHGAAWSKEWTNEVSHVIMDKTFDYAQLLSFLGLECVPQSVVVVNETYPAECLAYRCLLDPRQKSYQVQGYDELTMLQHSNMHKQPIFEENHLPESSQSSTTSLPLKPPGRGVLVREPQTPSITDGESIERSKGRLIPKDDARDFNHLHRPISYNDALEDTITKAKAIMDVVGICPFPKIDS